MMINPDVKVNLRFHKTEENGKRFPTPPDFFRTIFVIGDAKHDCRLLLKDMGQIYPGDHKDNVAIKFLCPNLVLPKLKIGTKFYLWEVKNYAEGSITEIRPPDHKLKLIEEE